MAKPMSMVMPRAFSSGRRSQSMPVRALTSDVLPWSMWPAVPRIKSRGMGASFASGNDSSIVTRRDREKTGEPTSAGGGRMLGTKLDVRPFLERVGQELLRLDPAEVRALADAIYA